MPDRDRIFISYGRADAGPLAERLEKELEQRGFKVWRDRTQIRAGREWENQVVDGLRSTQLVVALLSPHSTRSITTDTADSDSVCLDELAWARYERPASPIVPVIAVPGSNVPLTIYRLHRIDMVNALLCENVFQEKLNELLAAIDATLKGKPVYCSWNDWLKPSLDFDRLLFAKRANFTGRQWLFDEVDAWRRTSKQQALLIKGDPGIGKTAIIAEMSHRQFYGSVLATYCCQWDIRSTLSPAMFVQMIASQIASRLPAYGAMLDQPPVRHALEQAESDPASAFEMGVLTPLGQLPAPEDSPRLLLIDALDEALSETQGPTQGPMNGIVELIGRCIDRFPPWLRLVATTRRDPRVLSRLGGLKPVELDAHGPDNRSDLGTYVRVCMEAPNFAERLTAGRMTIESASAKLVAKADGNFLYAQQILRAVESDTLDLKQLDQLPPGLDAIYTDFFTRAFPLPQQFAVLRPILEMVCAAFEPLSRAFLARAAGMDERQLTAGLAPIRQMLVDSDDSGGTRRISFWHKSLVDWLTNVDRAGADFSLDASPGHRLLAQACRSGLSQLEVAYRTQQNALSLPHSKDELLECIQRSSTAAPGPVGYSVHATDHLSALRDWHSYIALLENDFAFASCLGDGYLAGVGVEEGYIVQLPTTALEMPASWQASLAITMARHFLHAAQATAISYYLDQIPVDSGKFLDQLHACDPEASRAMHGAAFRYVFQASRIISFINLAIKIDSEGAREPARSLLEESSTFFSSFDSWGKYAHRCGFSFQLEDQTSEEHDRFSTLCHQLAG